MRQRRLRFPGSQGYELSGQLDIPEGDPLGYAVLAHCFTCSKNFKATAHIGRALVDSGLGVLRFDFTGLGESDGDFAETNLSSNVEDLVAASRYLEREFQAPRLLLGHSLGGAAVLRAAPRIEACTAVVTLATPADPGHLARLLASSHQELETSGEAEITIGGRPYRIRAHFLEDLRNHPLPDEIANLGRALLIMHSPVDEVVQIEHAARLFRAARHPKSFVSLDRADHLLSDPEDGRYAGSIAACWAHRYVVGG